MERLDDPRIAHGVTNGVKSIKNHRFEIIEGRVGFLGAGDGHLPQPSDVAAVLGALKGAA